MPNSKEIIFTFPKSPYNQQKTIIKAIIEAIKNNSNALIESPTGTGKSLAIAAAIDSYYRNYHTFVPNYNAENRTAPKFFVLSRTHLQLEQLHKVLTANYNLSVGYLASRKHSCIHQKVKESYDINLACQNLIKHAKCKFYQRREQLSSKLMAMDNATYTSNKQFTVVIDEPFQNKILKNETESESVDGSYDSRKFNVAEIPIGLIKKEGINCRGCPYFASRHIAKNAVITLSPYNYIFDPFIFNFFEISSKDSVSIVDEAHNIESICRDGGSINIGEKEINISLNEVLIFKKKGSTEGMNLIEIFTNLIKFGKSIIAKQKHVGTFDVIMQKYNITKDVIFRAYQLCKKLTGDSELDGIMIIMRIIGILYFAITNPDIYAYQFNLLEENRIATFSIQLILLDPAFIFREIQKQVRSIILLSGTSQPFNLISSELSLKSENYCLKHVIARNDLHVNIISTSNNRELKGVYGTVQEDWYLLEIMRIINSVRVMLRGKRGGVSVFIQSYHLINRLKQKRMSNIFYEDKENFNRTLEEYKNTLETNPILICVYRGKGSEGTDFSDDMCRAVILVGIPYPTINDIAVKEKKAYNDRVKRRETLKSTIWYQAQAAKAVNQAIGRVVRHKNDWGIAFLVDSRYSYFNMLSEWIKPHIMQKRGSLADCKNSVIEFYKNK